MYCTEFTFTEQNFPPFPNDTNTNGDDRTCYNIGKRIKVTEANGCTPGRQEERSEMYIQVPYYKGIDNRTDGKITHGPVGGS